MCSRCLTQSCESAAKVCGIDDVVLRLHEGNFMVLRCSLWAHGDRPPAQISIDEPEYRWVFATWYAPHVPTLLCAETISRLWVLTAGLLPSYLPLFASKKRSWN